MRNPKLSEKTNKIISRLVRIIHTIGGLLGFIAMMLFVGFINQLNELLSIYKFGVLFYLTTIVFCIIIILGFFASISEIVLVSRMRASSPVDDILIEDDQQLNEKSNEDVEVIEDDVDIILDSPVLDDLLEE